MRPSLAALSAGLLLVALVAAGCGGESPEVVKIGVLADCTGPLQPYRDLMLAGAEIPLLERGAETTGAKPKPSDGVTAARVSSTRVELVFGCSEWSTYRVLIAETRRLVEKEGVDVVVGPNGESDGIVARELARTYSGIAFLPTQSLAPEVTLRSPAGNLFRFQPDAAQQAAGLGSYAYHELGWRTAAVLAGDWVRGWPGVAGFVAEFCALGGRVVSRVWTPGATPFDRTLVRKIPRGVDGVALIPGIAFVEWGGFAKAFARRHPDVAQHLVLGPDALLVKANRETAARIAPGIVGSDQGRLDRNNLVWRRMQRTLEQHFPGLLPRASSPAESALVVAYRNAVEAVLQGLGQAGGDPARLGSALARLELEGPTGRISLDANRQAIAPVYLNRVERDARGKAVVRTLRVVPNVEQTFGGYFNARTPPPSRREPACRRATPPPWVSP